MFVDFKQLFTDNENMIGIPDLKDSTDIAQYISSQILPALEPGQKLPPERALAERFSVSRTIIRKALVKLECKNLIRTKQGSGSVFLGLSNNTQTIPGLEIVGLEIGPFELIQARVTVECAIIRLAAQVTTPTDIRDLTQIVTSHDYYLNTNFNLGKINEFDTKFHLRLAETTHNIALVKVIEFLRSYVGSSQQWEVFLQYFEKDRGQLDLALLEHKAMLNALRQKDGDRAADAMFTHINRKTNQLKDLLRKNGTHLDGMMF